MRKLIALILALLSPLPALGDIPTGNVFDTTGDAGRFTIRGLWLGPQTGQDKPGDSAILTAPNGQIMVLDAGHPDAASYVIAALDAMGVTRIDYLVASHPHIDHIGGFPALMERYEVGAVYTSAVVYDTSAYYRAYMEAIERHGIPHIILAEGDTLDFGGVRMDVLGPGREIEYYDDYPKGSTQFINNLSLVTRFTFGASSYLSCGDLYTAAEREYVERYGEALRSDVVKANHHGIDTSSSPAWRKAVGARYALIICDVISNLSITRKYNRDGCVMLHTFLDGNVRLSTAGDGTFDILVEKARTTTLFD